MVTAETDQRLDELLAYCDALVDATRSNLFEVLANQWKKRLT